MPAMPAVGGAAAQLYGPVLAKVLTTSIGFPSSTLSTHASLLSQCREVPHLSAALVNQLWADSVVVTPSLVKKLR